MFSNGCANDSAIANIILKTIIPEENREHN